MPAAVQAIFDRRRARPARQDRRPQIHRTRFIRELDLKGSSIGVRGET
jgi:hypothetical protein